jgi:hypothetical protein
MEREDEGTRWAHLKGFPHFVPRPGKWMQISNKTVKNGTKKRIGGKQWEVWFNQEPCNGPLAAPPAQKSAPTA